MCATCVAQGVAYVGVAGGGLRALVWRSRARLRRQYAAGRSGAVGVGGDGAQAVRTPEHRIRVKPNQ